MNIKESLIYATNKLQASGIKLANLEARILVQHALSKPIEYLLARSEEVLSNQQQTVFENLLNRRVLLEPIAYIVGYKEFYGYQFIVDNTVLIPRQDTESIIDAILSNIDPDRELTILELGIGTGCIAISLLLSRPNLKITATDISNDAIFIAKQNAIKHKVVDKLIIVNSNWFDDLDKQKFDIIVSNPPYISFQDMNYMALETMKYEPDVALFAENNGLASYQIIAKEAKNFLKQQGKLFLEIGFNQLTAVSEIFIANGYVIKQVYRDLGERDRGVLIVRETCA